MNEPTNADLFVLIENQTDEFKKHSFEDQEVAKHQALVNERQEDTNVKVEKSLDALHEWKDTVATKEDIKELKEFMRQVNIGFGVFRFSWNNAGKIGAFLLLIGAIIVFFKVGLAAAFAFLFGKPL